MQEDDSDNEPPDDFDELWGRWSDRMRQLKVHQATDNSTTPHANACVEQLRVAAQRADRTAQWNGKAEQSYVDVEVEVEGPAESRDIGGTHSPNDNASDIDAECPDAGVGESNDVEEPKLPTGRCVIRRVHVTTLIAEDVSERHQSWRATCQKLTTSLQRGTATQQLLIQSRDSLAILVQLGKAMIDAHGPIGWLDKRGAELSVADTYCDESCLKPISRQATAEAATRQNSGEPPPIDSKDSNQATLDDGAQRLLESNQGELEARVTRMMDLALSTVLPEVMQALLDIRGKRPEDPLRYLVSVADTVFFFWLLRLRLINCLLKLQIDFLKMKEAQQFAKAEAEAFLAFQGRMAQFAAEDRAADEKQALHAQMYATLDFEAF